MAVDDRAASSDAGGISFEAFYRDAYPVAVRLAYVLTGRRAVAEELAQDTLLACYRRWGQISRYDDPVGWVRRVVTNRCISSGRRHVTEVRLLARLHRERHPEPMLSDGTDRLWEAVRALPKRQAQVLAMAFVEDLDVRAIATVLAIGEETVRTHLRRGRAAVAAQLTEGTADD